MLRSTMTRGIFLAALYPPGPTGRPRHYSIDKRGSSFAAGTVDADGAEGAEVSAMPDVESLGHILSAHRAEVVRWRRHVP
jgi:hypothetical protein